MKLIDAAKAQEVVEVVRREVAEGVVSVAEEVPLAAEFRIRRWRSTEEWARGDAPYLETRDGGPIEDCILTNSGGLLIWKALRDDAFAGGGAFNNTNTKVVVSNVTGSPAATDVTVVNEIGRKAMDTSFPLVPGESAGGRTAANREFVVRGTFGSSDANGDWRRFWIVNSEGTEKILDDFSSNQGTKVSGQVWELTVGLLLT